MVSARVKQLPNLGKFKDYPPAPVFGLYAGALEQRYTLSAI
tara:strand:+ start:1266 stop:1388 length:123 start_codon:yes stop_codon:yes gene_type:complete